MEEVDETEREKEDEDCETICKDKKDGECEKISEECEKSCDDETSAMDKEEMKEDECECTCKDKEDTTKENEECKEISKDEDVEKMEGDMEATTTSSPEYLNRFKEESA